MTPDLVRLRGSVEKLGPVFERLELELIDDPSWQEPSDTSYLKPEERANPDIASNVDAMAKTNELIAWFGKDAEGYVGLWRGPNERPLDAAPVVRLDTEGQYSIVAATVADYLAISVPEDEFASVRDVLAKAGFQVGFNPDAIWGALDDFDDDPNAYRNELYEQNRKARGLPSVAEQLAQQPADMHPGTDEEEHHEDDEDDADGIDHFDDDEDEDEAFEDDADHAASGAKPAKAAKAKAAKAGGKPAAKGTAAKAASAATKAKGKASAPATKGKAAAVSKTKGKASAAKASAASKTKASAAKKPAGAASKTKGKASAASKSKAKVKAAKGKRR